MKRFQFIGAMLCAIFFQSAHAVGNLTDISIYDRHENRVLPVYQHGGKYYVAGKPGNEYQIKIRNQSGLDLLAITSVDGVNVLSGETASWNQRGYIFTAGDGYDIMGWRKSTEQVAAFYFTSLSDSYAARTGRPDNVGVIGVALFRRKDTPPTGYALPRNYSAPAPMPERMEQKSADAPAPAPAPLPSVITQSAPAGESARAMPDSAPLMKEKSLGTGHGRNIESSMRLVNFERASTSPDEVITIYYDSYRNLAARGVVPVEPLAANPFPQSFVPDPPLRWWP